MRHRKNTKKLQRTPAAGLALRRGLALGLIEHGAICTTLPKARVLRPFAEKLLTMSRKGSLASHRLVVARLGNQPGVAKRLREYWVPKFKDVPGGYLRIKKLGPRKTDGAEMAKVEFVVSEKSKPAVKVAEKEK